MASDDTTTVLDEAGTSAVKLMLSKLDDHDVTVVFEMVGGTGMPGRAPLRSAQCC